MPGGYQIHLHAFWLTSKLMQLMHVLVVYFRYIIERVERREGLLIEKSSLYIIIRLTRFLPPGLLHIVFDIQMY